MRADVRGYVRVRVKGPNGERFFSLCAHRGFYLWNLEAKGECWYVNMLIDDFKASKDVVKKTGVKVAIIERTGLPFFMVRVKKRSMFVAGAVCFLVFMYVSANMLWHIELNGNYSISQDAFFTFLEGEGIYKGMWIEDIDIEGLEKNIRKTFDLVTWTSGKMDGTKLIIDIKENEKALVHKVDETTQNQEEATAFYATVDGIIHSIYTRKGIPLVKKGQTVEKGELLVDGRVPILLEDMTVGSYQLYDVDADVFIDTELEVCYALDKIYVDRVYTGREKKGYYIYFIDKLYPLVLDFNTYHLQEVKLEKKNTLNVQEDAMISYGEYMALEYQQVEKIYGKEEASRILEEYLSKKIAELEEKGVQILTKNVTIKSTVDKWMLEGVLQIRTSAVEKLPIYLEDLNDGEGI